MKIFTYLDFEPEKIPPYLNLCIKTRRKYLPDGYETVILNKKNLAKYLPKNLLPGHRNKCSFPHFFDYLSALVLYENGGIFMDADTIMTDSFCEYLPIFERRDVVLFGMNKFNICPGFIKAEKKSPFIEELIRRYIFKSYLPVQKNSKRNFVINDVMSYFDEEDVTVLDCEKTGYYMEKSIYGVFDSYLYKQYYFENYSPLEDFIKTAKGLTALHNSLTPQKFKTMDEKKFLNQEILLSKIFKTIL